MVPELHERRATAFWRAVRSSVQGLGFMVSELVMQGVTRVMQTFRNNKHGVNGS